MAIIFSIQTHLSTDFVDLSEPIDAGLFFEKQWRIGISSWELCGLKQIVIDEILDGDIYSVIGPYSMEDVQRTLYPSRSSTKNTLAIIEDELELDDDGLVSADFPYRDDDEILTAIPPEFWSCQTINIRSSDVNDMKWVISRVFLMVGTIFGVTASCFLVVLIISRAKTQANDKIKRAPKQHIQSYNGVGPRKENQHAAVQSLDTISTGYRPIASLFLITYLFQCVTFIFLDSEICKSHDCHISSGAISLLAACILLEKAAELGHAEAQRMVANSLATGILPLSDHSLIQRYAKWQHLNSNHATNLTALLSNAMLEVPDDFSSGGEQLSRAIVLWHLSAMDGNVESAMALGFRHLYSATRGTTRLATDSLEEHVIAPGYSPVNGGSTDSHGTVSTSHYGVLGTCPTALAYYEAVANGVMDELESGPTKGKVPPPLDEHRLAQIHMRGGASVALERHNLPDEIEEALQYYRCEIVCRIIALFTLWSEISHSFCCASGCWHLETILPSLT
jgi:hypothetical protein